MKYCMLKFLLIVFLLLACTGAKAEVIKIGYFELPPHFFTDEKAEKPKGAFVSYFEKLASEIGYKTEWVGPLPLPRLTAYLENGEEIDGTLGFPEYPQLKKYLYYSEMPIFRGKPVLIVRKDNPLKQVLSVENIRGYRIGLIKSLIEKYTPLFDNNRHLIKLEPIGSENWLDQNLNKLLAGRLDALYDRQQYTIPFIAKKKGLDAHIKVLALPDPPTPFYIVFSKLSKKSRKFLRRCNLVSKKLHLNYEALLQKQLASEAYFK